MSKLLNKSTDVNQFTISGMAWCSPEFVSQLKNYAATVAYEKSRLTENRLTRYETALEDNDDDEYAADVKKIKEEIQENTLTHLNFYEAIYNKEITDEDRNLIDTLYDASSFFNQLTHIDLGYNISYFRDAEISEKILSIFSVQEKLQLLELKKCGLSSEVTKDLMHILNE